MNKIEIEFPNGLLLEEPVGATLTQIDHNHFRYEAEPLAFLDAEQDQEYELLPRYMDEFEVEVMAPGKVRFIRITKRAEFERFDWCLPDAIIASDVLRSFKSSVEREGGYWERIFGGILVVYIPVNSMLSFKQEFGETIKRWSRFYYKRI